MRKPNQPPESATQVQPADLHKGFVETLVLKTMQFCRSWSGRSRPRQVLEPDLEPCFLDLMLWF